MYIPDHFAELDVAVARAFIEAHSFGMLIGVGADGAPEIAHIPFVLDVDPAPMGTLRAHVARANPLGALLRTSAPVIAVFTGPHAYVSPRFYESRTRNVPTWNFTAVHTHGIARVTDDRDEVKRALADLTAKHETDQADPWSIDEAEPRYLEGLLGAVIAFSIPVERFETKMKLSQIDRPAIV